jgi:hypothetical protein
LIVASNNDDCRAHTTGEHLVCDVPDHGLAGEWEQQFLRAHSQRPAGGK